MRVFVDMDGVVADFVNGVCNFYDKEYPYPCDPPGDPSWDIVKLLGMRPTEFWQNLGKHFWSSLSKTPDADLILDMVKRFTAPDEVCFLTSPCQTKGCMEGKVYWAKEHYPDIPILFSVAADHSLSPKWMCAGPDSVLIDDHSPNIDKWTQHGGAGVLLPRPWNRLHSHDTRDVLRDLQSLLQSFITVDLFRCDVGRVN
jgi:hypothetical protein